MPTASSSSPNGKMTETSNRGLSDIAIGDKQQACRLLSQHCTRNRSRIVT